MPKDRKHKVHTVPELEERPGTYVFPVANETAHGAPKYLGGAGNPVGGNYDRRRDRDPHRRLEKEARQELPDYELTSISDKPTSSTRHGRTQYDYYDSTARSRPAGTPQSDSSKSSARGEMSGRVVEVDATQVPGRRAVDMTDALARQTGHLAAPWQPQTRTQREIYESTQLGAWAQSASGQTAGPGSNPAAAYAQRYQQYPYTPPQQQGYAGGQGYGGQGYGGQGYGAQNRAGRGGGGPTR